MNRVFWTNDAPCGMTLDRLLYEIRKEDGENGLIFDSVSIEDIMADADEAATFDDLVMPYNRLERSMNVMLTVMKRAAQEIQPVSVQISDPFKKNGVAQVAAVFELSDGQTVSIFFHNPDATPQKLGPQDELISWKWLLNKKDITIAVAPERGTDLKIQEVGRRVMKLAAKNSAAFQRANAKRAERLKNIAEQKTQIEEKDKELKQLLSDIDAAKVELEDAKAKLIEAQKAADERRAAAEAEAKRKAEEAAKAKAAAAEAERKAKEEAARKEAEEAAKKAKETTEKEAESNSQWEQDRRLLQSVIDGTNADMLAPELADKLEEIAMRWESDPTKAEMLEKAVDAYVQAALKATENL